MFINESKIKYSRVTMVNGLVFLNELRLISVSEVQKINELLKENELTSKVLSIRRQGTYYLQTDESEKEKAVQIIRKNLAPKTDILKIF